MNEYHWIYRKTREPHVYARHQLHVSPNVEIVLGLARQNAEAYAKQLSADTGKTFIVVTLPAGTAAPKKCIPLITA